MKLVRDRRRRPVWKPSCWPATPAPRPGSRPCCRTSLPAQSYGRLLLVPGSKAPAEVTDAAKKRGKQVCTCFNVTDAAIAGYLAGCSGSDDTRLAALQGSLKCGTNCGSCIPELKRLVRNAPVTQAIA